MSRRELTKSIADVTFSTTSSLYQIVSNTTANCTLEQYTWAIPSDFDVSNPKYQIGLFDGGAIRGDNNNGWRSWSPAFYVREKNSAISASMTATTTGLLTATAQTSATVTATPTTTSSSSATATTSSSNHNSSGSSSTAVGVGVGVGVGCAALIAAGAFWFIWRRRRGKRGTRLDEDGRPGESVELPVKPVQELGGGVIDSKGKIPLGPQEAGGQGITKIRGLHEME